MGDRKVSNSKSELQGHSRALTMVTFDRPHTIFFIRLPLQSGLSISCTVSEILGLSLISQNLKRSRDPEHIPFGGKLVTYHSCTSTPLYQSAISMRHLKCLVSQTPKIWMRQNGRKRVTWRDPDHAHHGVVCHSKASIWYIPPAYKIRRLSLQPLRGYYCGHRNWVMWPDQGYFVIHGLRFDTFYLFAKFDDSSINRFRDIIGRPKLFFTWPWPRPF